jgi:protein transport protein YIF1
LASQPQSQGYDGSPYQQQHQQQQQQPQGPQAAGNMFGQYGNFINDPTAQLASQFGQTAFKHGQEYLEHNVSRAWNPRCRGCALGVMAADLEIATGEPIR